MPPNVRFGVKSGARQLPIEKTFVSNRLEADLIQKLDNLKMTDLAN